MSVFSVTVVAALSLAAASDEPFKRLELKLEGRVNHVLSKDLDGDGLAEFLSVVRTGTDDAPVRQLVWWQGKAAGLDALPVQTITLPENTVLVDMCDVLPAPGLEIVLLTDEGVATLVRDGAAYSTAPVLALPLPVLPFPDAEDAPFYSMCHVPKGGTGVELWVPGGRGVNVVVPQDGALVLETVLAVRPKAYHQSGDEFRGPRARRDFAVLTTLVMPRLTGLDADKDGDEDLYQVVEDTVALYLRDKGKLQPTPVMKRHFNTRNAMDRAKRNAVMDVMLGDFTGDGVPDAVVTKLSGGMTSLKSETRLFLGTGVNGFAAEPISVRKADGYATPLGLFDVDGNGTLDVLEPHIKTSPVAVAGMLVKQRVDAELVVLRSDGKTVTEGKELTVGFALDTSGGGGVKGGLPMLGEDVDQDGRMDIINLGSGTRVELHRGTKDDPPFEEDPSWKGGAPSTLRGDWYQPWPGGPASVVLFFPEQRGQASMVVFWNVKTGMKRP